MIWINLALLVVIDGLLLLLAVAGGRERSPRAAALAVLAMVLNTAAWGGLIFGQGLPVVRGLNIAALVLVALLAAVSLVRRPVSIPAVDESTIPRFDEREHMFARTNTWRHEALARRYYRDHPDRLEADRRIQSRPRLGEPGGRFYDEHLTPLAEAAFDMLDATRHLATGDPANRKTPVDPADLSIRLLAMARLYGAVDAGITRLKPHHVYSHRGRQAEGWGEPVAITHSSALVIVVAMDEGMIRHAPTAPVMVESSRQYVESARIAHVLARYIRSLGYAARSHVDGCYEVICPPLARDAGLGEIGRMSVFMHRTFGPCVRLAVVTTELELVPTGGDYGWMDHFCEICRKCADNCPSAAIPKGGRPTRRGFPHWSVDQEQCYGFWRTIGTDCAFCIRVCPFTKPDTGIHRLVRWYIARNAVNRHLALWADDLFYGRHYRVPDTNPPWSAALARHIRRSS